MSEKHTTPGTYLIWAFLAGMLGWAIALIGARQDASALIQIGWLIAGIGAGLGLIGIIAAGVKSGQHRQP